MIPWGSKNHDRLLKMINRKVTDGDCTGGHEHIYFPEDEEAYLTYLSGGYWRAIICKRGIRLVNPDRTPEEINTVEEALCILLHLDKWEE